MELYVESIKESIVYRHLMFHHPSIGQHHVVPKILNYLSALIFNLFTSGLWKKEEVKHFNSSYVCFTAFLVLCELPQSGRKFGFSHELPDLAHLTLLDGPIGFNEIGQLSPITLLKFSVVISLVAIILNKKIKH